jgi:ubiquinone/menaquinone biosynthesis C-methylase UbiE
MKPGWIARQSRRPSGWIGEIVARLMERETRPANAFVLAQLGPGPEDDVLEIGCGTGRCLERLARRGPTARAAGIDPSDVMVRIATRRLRREIARGRVEVRRAEAAQLPFEPARFDAALAVHVLYFWPDPKVELREIRRILRPGGVLVLGFRPDDPGARSSLPEAVYHLRSAAEVEALLRECGFDDVHLACTSLGGAPFACLRARAGVAAGDITRARP